jgi:EAL domain-containing protein (putative c-di-GMP-specific phosphodiesterase class I)
MNTRELEAHFQPQVCKDEHLTGFEALVRWNHPRRGLIYPSEFIPALENSSMMNRLGSWILLEACQRCKRWRRNGLRALNVSINVSAIQFNEPDFAGHVLEIVACTGIDPRQLTIEITETAFLKDLAKTAAHLTDLRSAGIRTALDDFGCGYSSLICLAKLPIDMIKLDHGFVAQTIEERPAMLKSIVNMAQCNGFQVLAEGVETAAQSRFLRDAGCDGLQGFYYGRPMSSAEVGPFLENQLTGGANKKRL